MKQFFRTIIGLLLLSPGALPAEVVSLDLNDGTVGQPIEDFYLPRGVTFSNVQWLDPLAPPFDGIDDHFGSSLPLTIGAIVTNSPYVSVIDEESALIATFPQPVDSVSINALDVGVAGAMIKAYDSAVGGNLIASDSAVGVGAGNSNFVTLAVAAPGIRRVELFQPFVNGGDGTHFDDLQFSTACDICDRLTGLEEELVAMEGNVAALQQTLDDVGMALESLDSKVDLLLSGENLGRCAADCSLCLLGTACSDRERCRPRQATSCDE